MPTFPELEGSLAFQFDFIEDHITSIADRTGPGRPLGWDRRNAGSILHFGSPFSFSYL